MTILIRLISGSILCFMTKQELRKRYLQKRVDLSEAEYAHRNFQVYQHFFSGIDLSFIKVLHTFLPIAAKREVDTWLIIERLRREFPHILVVIPKAQLLTQTLEHYYFEGPHQLATNAWGVPEPKQGIRAEPETIDLVLIPLLAYDITGHRLGYGKGFYDRFLKQCKPTCLKMGLSLFQAEEKLEGTTELDVRLNKCVSPKGIISF